MSEVVRFATGEGSTVLVEVDEDSFGVERVSRGTDGVRDSGRVLTDALASVKDAAKASIDVLKQLSPDGVKMEFGIKLAGEAGALIAKSSAEAHFVVKLTWSAGESE